MALCDFWLCLLTYDVGDDEVSDKPEEAVLL
jgi:hypothetical protein